MSVHFLPGWIETRLYSCDGGPTGEAGYAQLSQTPNFIIKVTDECMS